MSEPAKFLVARDRQRKYSLSATWAAIRSVPTDHFPLILPNVHPVAAFFILRQLKHKGFSNCRVITTGKGLVVHADR